MDESSLVRRAARGEAAARRRLVERHGAEVWALCRRLAAEPDDAYQSTWEKVFRVIGSFTPDGSASLGTWIGVVARRTLVDLHRRALRRGPVLPAVDEADPTHPAERVEAAERARRLWEAIDELPPDQRHVVIGHHVQGEPLEQLAREVGVSVGTIKSRLHRGRARLVQRLREGS